ncbi:MAG: HAMP domain-containing histidine kinase [Bacteroidales bacterium]|nr:HAMP domain-containing histidine kinase [Bacteroidales bacterium]
MKKESDIYRLRYRNYINDITEKRINSVVIISIFLLLFLCISDVFIRNNVNAIYTRIPPLLIGGILISLRNLKRFKRKSLLTSLYNFLLATLLAMMFAKYLIHLNSETESISISSIITAIFIVSLEIRTNLVYTILIYLIPFILFFIVLFSFFSATKEQLLPFINVFIMIIVGFSINRIQNNLRYKNFKSGFLLNVEKQKLFEKNKELQNYQNKLQDLVEEKTKSLQIALKKVKESDELKTSFLQNISHEIRTPMNAVLGFVHLLSEKNKEAEKEFEIIDKNLRQLLKTIDDIILLSELQTKQFKITPVKFAVNSFMKSQCESTKKNIEENLKPILVSYKKDAENDIKIKTDKDILSKIFSYILENAVKFSDSGEIKLSYKIENNQIIFIISDNGIGISDKNLLFVFDLFRKFENSNNIFRGVGIGLSIAKELTNILNGKITIKSKEKKGTTVEIILPANKN